MVRGALLLGATALLAAACTPQEAPRPGPGGSGAAAPSATSSATSSGTPSAAPGDTPRPPDPGRTPLLVTNPRGGPLDLPLGVARRAVTGAQERVAGLRVVRGRAAKRLAGTRSGVLGVVPARSVDPSVQVVAVSGVDPLRRPAAYPLGPLPPARVTTLTVVGDVMLGRRVASVSLAAGDAGRPLRPMARRLASADVTVGNLESTLSRAGAPTQGGDSFAAPPAVRGALRAAGFDALSLANNHTGDFGPVALGDTVRLLREAGLLTFGAGRTVPEAWAPAVVRRGGVSLGFLGFNAIGETPAVAPGSPGAVSVGMPPRTGPLAETELRRFLQAVRRLDRRVDVVVVLPHWGTQYTNRPEPVQWQVARRLAGAGADVVVGGHPHWVQGAGMVADTLVVHSLGNFVFDMDFMDQTMRGLVAEVVLWDHRPAGVRFVPYRMDAGFVPRVQSGAAAAPTLDLFWEFSRLGASPR